VILFNYAFFYSINGESAGKRRELLSSKYILPIYLPVSNLTILTHIFFHPPVNCFVYSLYKLYCIIFVYRATTFTSMEFIIVP